MKNLFVVATAFILLLNASSVLAATETTKVSDDIQFRQIMAGLLGNQYSPEQMAQLVLATPQSLLDPQIASTPQQFIANIDKLARQIDPTQLFEKAKAISAQGYPAADITNTLRKTPITIVIFPGVFSEFIPNRAFEEVFRNTSSAASLQWQ